MENGDRVKVTCMPSPIRETAVSMQKVLSDEYELVSVW
jgi:hypothetical protein